MDSSFVNTLKQIPGGYTQPQAPAPGPTYNSGNPSANVLNMFGSINPTVQTPKFTSAPMGGMSSGSTGLPQSPSIIPTSTGGTAFPASQASGFNSGLSDAVNRSGSINGSNTTASGVNYGAINGSGKIENASNSSELSQFINQSYTTPNGGSLTTTGGAGGSVTGYTSPTGYSIDTSGSVPSSVLGSGTSYGDVTQQQEQYQDYVNALAQAQGYSPQYLQALQQQYGTQAKSALLGVNQAGYGANSANINANVATGNGYTGYSTDQANTQGGILQSLNSQGLSQNQVAQALNTQQGTQAGINLNTQQLARTGNIASAQSQLQYNPIAVAGQNALGQFNNLQQVFPDANIPSYDSTKSPAENQQIAMQAVQKAPSFQTKTPAGQAEATSLVQQETNLNNISVPFNSAKSDFSAMIDFMQKNRINDNSVPLVNQVQNAVNANLLAPGAVSAFQSYIQSLRANYTTLLGARGETPTDAGNSALKLIPDNLNIPQLQQVQSALNTNGQNVIDATQKQIDALKNSLNSGQAGSTQNTTNTTSNNSLGGWY